MMPLEYDPEKGGFIRPSSNENLNEYFQNQGYFPGWPLENPPLVAT